MNNPGAIPLVARAPDDILFRRRGAALTVRHFLRDVRVLSESLPDGAYLINLCQDRYHFTVALAAATLRGQISLLSADRSPGPLARLSERFGGAASVCEEPSCAGTSRHACFALPPEAPAGAVPPIFVPADQQVAIVFTSGSTGEPVGNAKHWGVLAARSFDFGERFGMVPDSPGSIVGTVPPQHMYGFETTVLLPLLATASTWCGPAFYPADIAEALRAVPAPRTLVTTPLQLRALVESGIALPPLSAIISATAPMDASLAAAAEARFGVHVLEIFGATETGSVASRRTVSGDVWTTYDTVRLEQPADGAGTLVVAPPAGPILLTDRLDLLDATHFRLLGRADDLVKLGGRRASLAGLNRILGRIPGVKDGVFVVPDDLDRRPAARLLAFVVAPDRSAEDILADLRRQIEPVFLPRRVVKLDSLPRNELGKLTRAATARLMAGTEGD
ncbi:MAG TPA: AMP-binding protein [Acetobacteraceae bacterium]|jgi:acyl-coenzyme A synthetase/AMP-(fatty) acid ligase